MNKILLILISLIAAMFVLPLQAAEKNTLSLEDRVQELEINNSLRNFDINGGIRLFYDDITQKQSGQDDLKYNWTRMMANLDFSLKATPGLVFYSRLAMSKFLNQTYSSFHGNDPNRFGANETYGYSAGASRNFTGPEAYFEKAYFDYTVTENLILSGGRMPLFDGTPSHHKDLVPRQGTYARFTYNVLGDGVALTYNLDSYLKKDHQLALRYLYNPSNNPGYNGGSYNCSTNPNANGPMQSMASIWSVMADYSVEKLSFAKEFGAILHFVRINSYDLPNFYVMTDAAGLGSGNYIVTRLDSTARIGFDFLSAHVELEDIAKKGVNFSVSYLSSTVRSSGGVMIPTIGTSLGVMTNSDSDTVRGNGVLFTLNYRIPTKNRPLIGLEYLKTDKNYFILDFARDDITNFYSTQGVASHIYYTYPLKENLTWRLGYKSQKKETENTAFELFGERSDIKDQNKITNTLYTQLRATF